MSYIVKKIISIVIVLSLTGAIWWQTDRMARRTDFAIKNINEATTGRSEESNDSEYEEELKDEFNSKEPDLAELINQSGMRSDSEFMNSVAKLFSDLYEYLKDVAAEGGEVRDADTAEAQFIKIFNGLFSLDEELYEKNPELMGELTNKGFVTAAISIVWDIVTYYDNNRVNSQTMAQGVTRLEDIPYIDDGTNEHMLDIFYPENTEEKLPVIIDIHGGGLMMGDKDSNRVYCSVLAARGYTVIALNYRLSPNVLYPSMVQDIMAAFRWINDNGGDYHCDLDNVYVTGDFCSVV